MARQADKSYYLKRLFDTQLVKTTPEAAPNMRQDQAAHLMDELVGPRWREEVNAEMELIPDLEEKPSAQEVEEFWGKVQQAGYAAGFGTEDITHDEPQDPPDLEKECGCAVPAHGTKGEPALLIIQRLLGLEKVS